MKGLVNNRLEAVFQLGIFGRKGRANTIAAVVDTGFSGYLTLPPSIIRSLGLRRLARSIVVLADGSKKRVSVYACKIRLGRRQSEIEVMAADADPLVGMELLRGFRLTIDVVPSGRMSLIRL